MKEIKKLILGIKHAVNSLYYFKFSIEKNVYPCKLIGEKIGTSESETIILYKILGQKNNNEILLKKLLHDGELIEKFHPNDAIKLGSLSLEEVIRECGENEAENKFNKIKNIMLKSTGDIYSGVNFENLKQYNLSQDNIGKEGDYFDKSTDGNTYTCKLVGGKINKNKGTIITFTILGKRDGHERALMELVENRLFLEKFHPTEAVKFGFIFQGDHIFSLKKRNQNQDLIQ